MANKRFENLDVLLFLQIPGLEDAIKTVNGSDPSDYEKWSMALIHTLSDLLLLALGTSDKSLNPMISRIQRLSAMAFPKPRDNRFPNF